MMLLNGLMSHGLSWLLVCSLMAVLVLPIEWGIKSIRGVMLLAWCAMSSVQILHPNAVLPMKVDGVNMLTVKA